LRTLPDIAGSFQTFDTTKKQFLSTLFSQPRRFKQYRGDICFHGRFGKWVDVVDVGTAMKLFCRNITADSLLELMVKPDVNLFHFWFVYTTGVVHISFVRFII
jgi:hypothetical protein